MDSTQAKPWMGWAILELMGHRKMAGLVQQEEVCGVAMLRIDVPGTDPTTPDLVATQYYSASALYCLTPTTESIARAFAVGVQPAPVQRWELPAADLVEDDDSPETAKIRSEPPF